MALDPCPVHGSNYRALHEHSFKGIVDVIDELIATLSGVGTTSFSRCPVGYTYNFEGIVRALEDLNLTASGISGGGGATASGIVAGSGIYITQSGDFEVINASVVSLSGVTYNAGSGIYLSDGGYTINLYAEGQGSVSVSYSGDLALISGVEAPTGGATIVVSGDPGSNYETGALWYDTNEGRLFVYASGGAVTEPAWYQTNAEAIALKSETAPSGTGENAPPRDGSIWFNTLMGSLFVYDATSSGWYETGPSRSFAYGPAAPASTSTQGAGWFDTTTNRLKVWDGSNWVDIDIDGGVY